MKHANSIIFLIMTLNGIMYCQKHLIFKCQKNYVICMNYKANIIEDYVRTLSIDDAERRALPDVQCILQQLGKQ